MEDGETIVLKISYEERRANGPRPETYFITDHYLNYPYILVSLNRIHPLRELIQVFYTLANQVRTGGGSDRVHFL
jgi:hypothetical protein